MNDIELIKKKIRFIYSQYNPLYLTEEKKELFASFSELAKGLLNVSNNQMPNRKELYVSVGYNLHNIKPNIRSFYMAKDYDILFFNALSIEFASDFMLFCFDTSYDSFLYCFSKYMRYFEQADHNYEASMFYNFVFSKYENVHSYDYRRFISQASLGALFKIFHEDTHRKAEQVNNTIALFRSSPTDAFAKNINENDLVEAACDFNAICIITDSDIFEEMIDCTKEEILEAALFEEFSVELYSLFSDFIISSINSCEKNNSVSKMGMEKVIDKLNSRYRMLVVALKAAQNSNLFFEDYDLFSTIRFVNGKIQEYFNYLVRFLKSDLQLKIKEFENQSSDDLKDCKFMNTNEVWNCFL